MARRITSKPWSGSFAAREQEELSRESRQHAGRRCTYFHDADGSLVVRLQLPAESGALLLKALEAAVQDVPLPDDCKGQLHVSAETFRPPLVGEVQTLSARRADAVVVLAESFLKHGAAALNGGERHQIVVHVDAESLRTGETGRCEVEDGPAVPVETARRLACDSSVVAIVEDARGEPLDVGRKTRSIRGIAPRAQVPRSGLPIPWLLPQALCGWAPRAALGRRRGDEAVEPRLVVSISPPRRT